MAENTNPEQGVSTGNVIESLKGFLDRESAPEGTSEDSTTVTDTEGVTEEETQGETEEEVTGEETEETELVADDDESHEESDEAPIEVDLDAVILDAGLMDKRVVATVDGEDIEITVEESVKGYQRLRDYTQKTQELATTRTGTLQLAEQFKQGMEIIGQFMAADLAPFESLDWEALKVENPTDFSVKQIEYSEARQRVAALQNSMTEANKAQATMNQQAAKEAAQKGAKELTKLIPEFRNEDTKVEVVKSWAKVAQSVGVSVQELAKVTDHRFMLLLDKAAKYDALVDKQAKVTSKKVVKRGRVVAKGNQLDRKTTASTKQVREVLSNFAKNKDVASATEALKLRLKGEL